MKCFGCKNDKPKSDFDKNPALCRTCVKAPVYRNRSYSGSGDSYAKDGFFAGLGSFFGHILDGITGN